MTALYFEDFAVGATQTTAARTITEADVVHFAGLSGDFNPLHTDAEFAATTAFGQRIAHGLLGLAVSSGLTARTGVFEGTVLAFLEIERWRFSKPILIGDTVRVRWEVIAATPTSQPGAGVVRRRVELLNQRGEVVQDGVLALLVRRRDGPAPSGDAQAR